ncbi:MAG: hypothetical protein ACK4SN_07670, partial [Bellilinea sp.]
DSGSARTEKSPRSAASSAAMRCVRASADRLSSRAAARFFVRRPLILTPLPDSAEALPAAGDGSQTLSPAELKQAVRLVLLILQKMRERGIL